jgi:hypothetical protein
MEWWRGHWEVKKGGEGVEPGFGAGMTEGIEDKLKIGERA